MGIEINTNEKATDKELTDFFKTGYFIAKIEDLFGTHCDSEQVVSTYLDIKDNPIDIEELREYFDNLKSELTELAESSIEDDNNRNCSDPKYYNCCTEIGSDDSEDVTVEDLKKDISFKAGYYVGRFEEKFSHRMNDDDIKNAYSDVGTLRFSYLGALCTMLGNAVDEAEGMCKDDRVFELRDHIPAIEKVIFSGVATIVFWSTGEKTVVKCQKGDTYSREEGLAMAICKMVYGNNNIFNDVINKAMAKAVVVEEEK